MPSLDADPSSPEWTGEIIAPTPDAQLDFGKREWRPHPLAKLILVSNPLIRKSTIGVEDLVKRKMKKIFGEAMENGYMTGHGAGQPLGVFTASTQGISTARDISAGNTETAIGLDGLFEARFAIKGSHFKKSRWIFSRDGVKQLAKMKDGDGRPIWQDSIKVGEPDILLSRPVHMSEFAPNTFTTGLYVGILGNFEYYVIADAMDMQVQNLLELYALTNQTGYIGRLESDGMPTLESAFARVTLA
jgi:HK97 family phage major capsid protein